MSATMTGSPVAAARRSRGALRLGSLRLAGVVLAALFIGGLVEWAVGPINAARGIQPIVSTGTITLVSGTGEAFGFQADAGMPDYGGGFALGRSVMVRGSADGAWRDGGWTNGVQGADCVQPYSSGARARLGIIPVASTGDGPGGPRLAWVECLSRPTSVSHP